MPRFLKSAYRKEPISSFILTIGAVDAVIGGAGDRWSLFTLGIGVIGVAIALRWWMFQQNRTVVESPERSPIHYLPSQSSRTHLPTLTVSPQKPPRPR